MKSRDPQQSIATGWTWATRVSTVGLEFALPALAGWWLDTLWSFGPVGVIAGACLGFAVGLMHLLKISKQAGRDDRS